MRKCKCRYARMSRAQSCKYCGFQRDDRSPRPNEGGNGRAPNPGVNWVDREGQVCEWFDVRSTVGRWQKVSPPLNTQVTDIRQAPRLDVATTISHLSPILLLPLSLQHTIRHALHTLSWYCALIALLYAPEDQALATRRATRTRNETDQKHFTSSRDNARTDTSYPAYG